MPNRRVTMTLQGINDSWTEFRSLTTTGGDRTRYINSLIEADRSEALEDPDTADRWAAFCKAMGAEVEA